MGSTSVATFDRGVQRPAATVSARTLLPRWLHHDLRYGWLQDYLDRTGTALSVRRCFAISTMVAGAIPAITLALGSRSRPMEHLVAGLAVIVISAAFAARWWLGGWPSQRASWVYLASMDSSITLSGWLDAGPMYGTAAVGALCLLSCYCALMHASSTLLAQMGASALILASIAVRVGDPTSTLLPSIFKAIAIGLMIALPSIALQLIGRELGQDAVRAGVDPLTHVLNRRGLTRELDLLANPDEAPEHPLLVALIDLDRFKAVNDTYGHSVGDQVLVEMAAALTSAWPDLIVGRIGGEEFVTAARVPAHEIDALRRALAGAVSNVSTISVTASIGIVRTERDAGYVAGWSLIALADRLMYEAKQAGGDQIRSL